MTSAATLASANKFDQKQKFETGQLSGVNFPG